MSEREAPERRTADQGGGARGAVDPLEGTPYRAIGRLGRGGMGVVLEAEHRRLGSRVVVKALHGHLVGMPDLVDRMHLEARTLAAVGEHPNIVAVTDGGTTPDGRPYIVMERLVGRSLFAERRLRGRLPPAEAIDLIRQVLAALGAVHAAGIVHRDVKPANLFLCDARPGERRVLKVLDFGIAKIVSRGGAHPAVAARALATEQSALVGTPPYLAPEQAVGGELDARTDLYAAGAVLFELLTGRAPFEHHAEMHDVLRAHLSEAPRPPSEIAGPAVPPELDRAVLRALAKRPADRFQDAEGFAEELARISRDLDQPEQADKGAATARAPRGERRLARPLALAVVWLVSMAVTVGLGVAATEVFR